MTHAWDRWPGEPENWYARFEIYRACGPERSIERAFQLWKEAQPKPIKSKRPGQEWFDASRKWQWLMRAAYYDDKEIARARAAEENERTDMLKRHIRIATGLQSAGLQKLQTLINEKGKDLTAAEVARFLKLGIDEERKARGFPTEILEFLNDDAETLYAKYAAALADLEAAGRFGGGDEAEGDNAPDDAGADSA